jgi:uncharacterized membrane protein (UPF0127 family)
VWAGMRRALRIAPLLLAAACTPDRSASAGPAEVAFVRLGEETFTLELALDPATRHQGLSGRGAIPRNHGMLFVEARSAPLAMVMRDCSAPIDVAFLDPEGHVVAVHEMAVEPPRARDETPGAYEARLPLYESGEPALFAIETAGGRLREVGLAVGDRVPLDARGLAARAR